MILFGLFLGFSTKRKKKKKRRERIFAIVNIYRVFTVCWALSDDPYSSLLNPYRHQTVRRTDLFAVWR